MDGARRRAQSPQHAGREAVEGDAAGGRREKEQTNKRAGKRLGDAQTKPDANGLVGEERSGEEWERREKVDGLVTTVGEMQLGQKWKRLLKQQNGSFYQDWEAGGRWQVVKVGRQRSSPWPVGYGPRFLPGNREDGRRNTMRLGLSRRPARAQRTERQSCRCLSRWTTTRLFLDEVFY